MIFNLRLRLSTKQSSVSEAVRVEFAELQKRTNPHQNVWGM